MKFFAPFACSAIFAFGAHARYVMYVDEYHTADLGNSTTTAGIDHAIMAFVPTSDFLTEEGGNFTLFEPIDTFRARFDPGCKIMVAIGGWGDTNYTYALHNHTMHQRFASNVKKMMDKYDLDGIDIDFEYPGGDGSDYKTNNVSKAWEIPIFPLFLTAIRTTIGPNATLSIAVPGLEEDMLAYTNATVPALAKQVDWFGIMSYDLMNRRSTYTSHHSSVQGTLDAVNRYLDRGLPAAKAHFGVAFYAKYFTIDPASATNCSAQPLGQDCHVGVLENADGSDNGKSGVLTFTSFIKASLVPQLKQTQDGSCGSGTAYRCEAGNCCSSSGYCGTSDEYCDLGTQPGYGDLMNASTAATLRMAGNATTANALDSWATAQANALLDQVRGGSYFFDPDAQLFWTWDAPQWVQEKFETLVGGLGVGGVGAWSLGEDAGKWEMLGSVREGVGRWCLSEVSSSVGNCSDSSN
ncbi:carbohydrate-binding module family 18 protein [Saccharata proteae CBS 121410]|uniref:chitinase n=1 Tax=Saccharata proteae CBS 121410 TaxID=1314787 RepID=A0A9P4I5R9_9PEZI|nr:carbohydrate-binding module family 18 protein [Saccharata proteae CBS 121410]